MQERQQESNYYDFACEQEEDIVHYAFITSTESIFSVYFNPPGFSDYLDDLPVLSEKGRLFGFFPVDETVKKQKHDPLIATTVCKIVEDYFETFGKDIVLLYHCDNEDKRQHIRSKLFDLWYDKKQDSLAIFKDTLIAKINKPNGDVKIEFLGFLAHNENSDALNQIREEFISISALLISRKGR